ncbi:hypothetical protein KSP40_PGU004815 [Platanthera guangdongensis]|uniref:Uncharacterized protein n=1 Tax=Platanthera guangdongensis TaxID=2320717 RepID=A0ABR2M1Q0_9ASPA
MSRGSSCDLCRFCSCSQPVVSKCCSRDLTVKLVVSGADMRFMLFASSVVRLLRLGENYSEAGAYKLWIGVYALLASIQGTFKGPTVLCLHPYIFYLDILANIPHRNCCNLQFVRRRRCCGISREEIWKRKKLPYNSDKSYAGTVAMALAVFLASIG